MLTTIISGGILLALGLSLFCLVKWWNVSSVGVTLLFKLDFLETQWIGTLVIGIYIACVAYIAAAKRRLVWTIDSSPEGRSVDFHKIETVH